MASTDDKADLIIRMFRLRPPSTASICIFFLILGSLMGGLILWIFLQKRREARRTRIEEEACLRRILARANLNAAEAEVFEKVAKESGASPQICATSVEVFDRGIERLLGEPGSGLEKTGTLLAIQALRKKLGLHASVPGRPIASTRMLPPEQPVLVAPSGSSKEGGALKGSLIASGEDSLTIRLDEPFPPAAGHLGKEREVDVAFSNPLDASYTFRTKVAAVEERGGPILVLSHPSTLVRLQRRSFARVEVREPVKFRWIPGSLRPEQASSPESLEALIREFDGVITSLSGGGIRLWTPQRLMAGDFLQFELPFLPGGVRSEKCIAQVVSARGSGVYGLRFEGLGQEMQRAIIRYVREREVDFLREVREGESSPSLGKSPAGSAGPQIPAGPGIKIRPEQGGKVP